MFDLFLDLAGAEGLKTTPGKLLARITNIILAFWIFVMGGYYGFLFGTMLGLSISAILRVESALPCYVSMALFGFTGLLIAYYPARFIHSVMNRLAGIK